MIRQQVVPLETTVPLFYILINQTTAGGSMATSFPRNTKQVVESDNAHLKLITPIYVLETLHKNEHFL